MNYSSFEELVKNISPKGELKPVVFDLTSVDANAFSLMGQWQKVARKAGWSNENIKVVLDECTSGDYDHLVCTLIEVSADEPDEDEDEDEPNYGSLMDDEDDYFTRNRIRQ